MKIRISKTNRRRRVIEVPVTENVRSRFSEAFDEIEGVLVSRSEEVEALKLCLITKNHLMLEGKHGIAKSQLADEAFRRIEGAVVFKKQFMKGTQTDEILGPMLSEEYRKGVWKHNTKGMLPECDFFFGDEIYRASDQALPVMMGILNEGEFINGGKVTKCPLHTAIGTTNFITDSEELEAFHDRWQVRVKSQPLKSVSEVRLMLSRILGDGIKKPKKITLDEIRGLHQALRNISFDEETLDIIPEVIAKFAQTVGDIFISDRRKAQSLNFMKAYALLDGKNQVEAQHIEGARFILTVVRDPAHAQAWASVIGTCIGEFRQSKAEGKKLRKMEKLAELLCGKYDEQMDPKDAKEVWDTAKDALAAIAGQEEDDKPSSNLGIARQDKIVRKLEELCQSIAQKNVF